MTVRSKGHRLPARFPRFTNNDGENDGLDASRRWSCNGSFRSFLSRKAGIITSKKQ